MKQIMARKNAKHILLPSVRCSSAVLVYAKLTDNPADELVAVLNANRTAHKSSSLADNRGLACIALQYSLPTPNLHKLLPPTAESTRRPSHQSPVVF
ncbi:hypothetical protein Gotur_017995 [Gossypium turneri]